MGTDALVIIDLTKISAKVKTNHKGAKGEFDFLYLIDASRSLKTWIRQTFVLVSFTLISHVTCCTFTSEVILLVDTASSIVTWIGCAIIDI